jgi:hypothetical protein
MWRDRARGLAVAAVLYLAVVSVAGQSSPLSITSAVRAATLRRSPTPATSQSSFPSR